MSGAAYPEYRDSGLPWLGRIPAHWEVNRAKVYLREVDERSMDGAEERLSVSHLTGVTPRREKNITMFEAESYVGHKVCGPGDVVVNTLWAWMGALGVARHHGIVSPAYHVYRERQTGTFEGSYLEALLRSPALVAEYRRRSTGIQESRLRLYPERLLDVVLPRPPIDEQRDIAMFLDALRRLVARYKRAKQGVIALLTERRDAIVRELVSRGLSRESILSPSGSATLGLAPSTWHRLRLKNLARAIVSGATPESSVPEYWDGEVIWATPEDVSRTERLTDSRRRLSEAGLHACAAALLPAGGVVVTSRAPVGNVAIADVELCTNQGCKGLVPDETRVRTDYLYWLLVAIKPDMNLTATGTTFTEISTTKFASLRVALPDLDEQRRIVSEIEQKVAAIRVAISQTRKEIVLVDEYAQSIGVAATLGAVDLRGAHASAYPGLSGGQADVEADDLGAAVLGEETFGELQQVVSDAD